MFQQGTHYRKEDRDGDAIKVVSVDMHPSLACRRLKRTAG
ncbi:hypothetical protein C6341_g26695 [Phytophthora cactorum]|nr:hypothetical protein C6341_g26695 [Phytophthora cactorum]